MSLSLLLLSYVVTAVTTSLPFTAANVISLSSLSFHCYRYDNLNTFCCYQRMFTVMIVIITSVNSCSYCRLIVTVVTTFLRLLLPCHFPYHCQYVPWRQHHYIITVITSAATTSLHYYCYQRHIQLLLSLSLLRLRQHCCRHHCTIRPLSSYCHATL